MIRRSLVVRSRAHLATVGESYWQHLRHAAAIGGLLVAAGLACLVHALVPAWFETTARRAVRRLGQVLDARPQAPQLPRPDGAPPFPLLPLLRGGPALLPGLAGAEPPVGVAVSLLPPPSPFPSLGAEAAAEPEPLSAKAAAH